MFTLSSANVFNLVTSKMLSFGKELSKEKGPGDHEQLSQ